MAFAHEEPQAHGHEAPHGTFGSYSLGFILSVVLTALSFGAVMIPGVVPHGLMIPVLIVLAVIQMFVHVYFFLHLSAAPDQRWNVNAFAFAVMTVLILVIGSMWIMSNVNYNMTGSQHGQSNMGNEM
jgi:cytochrome o ubiquinol oxidase subunit IV